MWWIFGGGQPGGPAQWLMYRPPGSSRRHVLGEELGDAVLQARYVEFPAGQHTAGSGVVTPPSSPSPQWGAARGGRFERANRFAWAAHPEDWPSGKAPAC